LLSEVENSFPLLIYSENSTQNDGNVIAENDINICHIGHFMPNLFLFMMIKSQELLGEDAVLLLLTWTCRDDRRMVRRWQ